MNRITVVGRIVREIELREVGDGNIVMNNSLAVPRTYKTDNGQEADFINFVAWGRRAELIEEYCEKGDQIGLDGRIQSRNYQNEEGLTVFVVEMLVDSVHFLQPRKSAKRRTNRRTMTQSEAAHGVRSQKNQTSSASQSTDQAAATEQAPQTVTEKISQATNKQPIQQT